MGGIDRTEVIAAKIENRSELGLGCRIGRVERNRPSEARLRL
jgi:hypothetical protein